LIPLRPDRRKLSIRLRLLLALGLLAAATIFIGGLSWYALDRADAKLEALHRQTLSEVARALTLSKRSTDLATSAPFLLGLKSPYLIRSEGVDLLAAIDKIGQQWPSRTDREPSGYTSFESQVRSSLQQMKIALKDLIDAADRLDEQRDKTLSFRSRLVAMDREFIQNASNSEITGERRRSWLILQKVANALIGAVHAENLPGLGEYQRRYTALVTRPEWKITGIRELAALEELRSLTDAEHGLFKIRRKELDQNLLAQNALFRIRYESARISDLALVHAQKAEAFLSQKRKETTSSIGYAKLIILGVGISSTALALLSALFVSGYVTGNIKAISNAMQRLAQGDRSSNLPRPKGAVDEIGKLLQSFRVFRANALRLDRSNKQLHRRNTLFEKIFNNISDGVAIIDEEGRLSTVNPSFTTVLHLPVDTIEKTPTIKEVLDNSPFANTAEQKKLGTRFRRSCELQSEEGDVLEVRCSRLPDGGEVWLFSDATERHRIEERLEQIQRIESLGKVTGEVAHDFANILSSISGNLHLLESRDSGADTSAFRKRIAGAVEIGTSLTQRLLAFARKQRLEPEKTELNTLVAGLEDLVGIGLKESVSLKTKLSSEKLYVCVDPGQLESAILNLCLNSNQAIDESGEISITVSSGANEMAEIIIADNGCGMEKAVLKRAMEPFYSARKDGNGTGLGLSSVYGFIKQSGGEFQIESAPGSGTVVRLSLPKVSGKDTGEAAHMQPARILVVEDEAEVMEHTSRALRQLGHMVDEASTFERAQSLLRRKSHYDVVLTDIHLDNGHSGWRLVDQCLKTHALTRVIVTSGRLSREQLVAEKYGDRVVCIPKPLTAEILDNLLRDSVPAQ